MDNEELKKTILLYLNEYHNSLFTIELNESQLEDIFKKLSNSIYEKVLNELKNH